MQSFFAAELAYLSAFCRAEPVEGGVRLRDDGIPDLYAHNLTYFAGAPSAPQLLRACAQEMRFRRAEGMPFLNLTVEGRAPKLPCAAMRTVYDYFVLREEIRAPRPDLAVLPLTPALCAQALAFDLDVNGRDYGRDFIRRRFVRRREVYLSGRVQHLLGYHAGRVVSVCDLFLCGTYAKIEDFDVSPLHQRQGFGRAMLAELIRRARRLGAETIYLVTDDADTAKEMYKKSGFVQAAQKEEILLPVSLDRAAPAAGAASGSSTAPRRAKSPAARKRRCAARASCAGVDTQWAESPARRGGTPPGARPAESTDLLFPARHSAGATKRMSLTERSWLAVPQGVEMTLPLKYMQLVMPPSRL